MAIIHVYATKFSLHHHTLFWHCPLFCDSRTRLTHWIKLDVHLCLKLCSILWSIWYLLPTPNNLNRVYSFMKIPYKLEPRHFWSRFFGHFAVICNRGFSLSDINVSMVLLGPKFLSVWRFFYCGPLIGGSLLREVTLKYIGMLSPLTIFNARVPSSLLL